MSGSNPSVSVNKLDLGPCQIFWNGSDLGGSLGNVTINFKFTKADMKADQYGTTVLDRAVSGFESTIETEIAETGNNTLLNTIFPNSVLSTSGSEKAVTFPNKVGSRDSLLTGSLRLHPMNQSPTNFDLDWNFECAMFNEESSYVFSPTEQTKWKTIWNVYPNLNVTPARFFIRGNPAIVT